MKINKNTQVTDIIDGHEKRLGTLELFLQGIMMVICLKSILRVVLDKFYNAKNNV